MTRRKQSWNDPEKGYSRQREQQGQWLGGGNKFAVFESRGLRQGERRSERQ